MLRFLGSRAAAMAARRANTLTPAAETIQVQRISVRRRRHIGRKLLAGFAVLWCVDKYMQVVFSPFAIEIDESELEEMRKTASTFMPLPFTTRVVTPPPYKGSDPEWKAFVRISKDPKLTRQIREDFISLLKGVVLSQKTFTSRLGHECKTRRWWLDIDYPSRPPQYYVHTGILMDAKGTRLDTRRADSYATNVLHQAMWPTAAASGVWAFAKTSVQRTVDGIGQFLGFNMQKPAPPPEILSFRQALSDEKREHRAALHGAKGRTFDRGSSTRTPSPSGPQPAQQEDKSPEVKDFSSILDLVNSDLMKSHLKAVRDVGAEPFNAYINELSAKWRKPQTWPPRGCLIVSGFIELEMGPAYLVMDVFGYWNPATKSFHAPSTVMTLRRVQAKTQTPRER